MNKMIDMKLPKPSKKDMEAKAVTSDYSGEQYPYGLRLRLGNDELEKIPGLKNLEIDEDVIIKAKACVISVSLDKSQGMKGKKERFSIELQIEQISIAKTNDGEDAFNEASSKKG
jgi:hypothetical protein